ncbi:MAG: SnoaL-like polyketide cyclase [Acidobacteriaceae bacterium]|jgi:predicted ester cyclase|nr:SnoaL-like polyketide cyclase [Acidobacteriaceae bacterium]
MITAEQAHVETVRRLYEEYLNQNRPELLASLVGEDVVLHTATEERGIAAYAALTDRLRVAFPDMQFTLQDLIAMTAWWCGGRWTRRIPVRWRASRRRGSASSSGRT